MVDTSWDINKYFDETEFEQQWILRKSFMEEHKNKYPENRLVCLAKIFINIEFLGCIYNSELMTLVRNLAKQVDTIVQYRESKKNKIGRTFVRASDAVKKNINVEKIVSQKRKIDTIEIDLDDDQSNKRLKRPITNEKDWLMYQKARCQKGYKGQLILYWNNKPEKDPRVKNNLAQSCSKAKITYKYKTTDHPTQKNLKIHQLLFDDEVLSEITSEEKLSQSLKTDLAEKALLEVKKYCFTVIPTKEFEIIQKTNTLKVTEDEPELHKGIGAKIMKMMGWKGEGLGKNESGIKDPIEAIITVNRKGFGNTQTSITDKKTIHEFKNNMREYIMDYLKGPETKPVQFSAEFTKEERMYIHDIVQKIPSLKSQSYGKGQNRAIRISKKMSGWQLVEELLENGGKTDSHILEKPTAL